MAGKPKPTHLKILEGNPGHQKINTNEPQPDLTMPSPPEHLSAEALTEWRRIAPGLNAMGLLSIVDRGAMAAYCQAYGRWVQAEKALAAMGENDELTYGLMIKTTNGNAIQNPLVGTANKAQADVVKYASEFGMTAAARARLSVPTERGSSKFGGLLNAKTKEK
jgi:P27 family predicted phage terminase small subunit